MSNSKQDKDPFDDAIDKIKAIEKKLKKKERKEVKKLKKKALPIVEEMLDDTSEEALIQAMQKDIEAQQLNEVKDLKVFVYQAGDGFVDTILKNNGTNDPKQVDKIFLRLDNAIKKPLQLNLDPDELFVIINNEYQINFADGVGEDAFFNDLFFFLEEIHGVPADLRSTSSNKIINLEDELKSLSQLKDQNKGE